MCIFAGGVCPVVVPLDKELKPGSFHTYKLQTDDGTAVACTLRSLDEFLRLGMYGAGDLADNVRRGITEASHFHTQTRAQLDEYLRFGVRNAFHIGETPAADVVGHPAVHAYLLHDEPDVWDAGSPWPEPLRIGFHGPDIVSPDCYPLTHAQPLRWVREVTEACRVAAGPRRVQIIPQVNWEDRFFSTPVVWRPKSKWLFSSRVKAMPSWEVTPGESTDELGVKEIDQMHQ